jgi:hypothetical protein
MAISMHLQGAETCLYAFLSKAEPTEMVHRTGPFGIGYQETHGRGKHIHVIIDMSFHSMFIHTALCTLVRSKPHHKKDTPQIS